MRDKDLYAQILGIKSPWQVSGVELALSEGEVTVHVEQEEGVQHCCPTCGEVSPGYDSRKRVFGLVIDFGTSQSPKSTRPLTTYWCPSRPGHQALRNNFASSLLLRTWLPMTGRRVRRPTLFSLWRKARRENSAASRLLGSTSLRFALHGWQRTPRPIAASPVTCRPWQIRDTIRWSPFKWPFRDSSMLIGVSSYPDRKPFIPLPADMKPSSAGR